MANGTLGELNRVVSFTQYTEQDGLAERVKKVKAETAKSAEQKLMEKYNVVDSDGLVTDTGFKLVHETLFEANKQIVLDQLQVLEDASKAAE